jgi:hypothetical protein
MMLVVLAVLAMIDFVLCGFRAAAGRQGSLYLRSYYLSHMRSALVAALILIALFGACGMLCVHLQLCGWSDFDETARRMVIVYGSYAAIVVLALGVYLLHFFELSVLATVVLLGPMTLLRPLLIASGAAWAVLGTAPPVVTILQCAITVVALAFQPVYELRFRCE